MWGGRTLERLGLVFQTSCSPPLHVGVQLLQPFASPKVIFISAACCQLGPKRLALLEVNGDGEVATGAIEPIHHQSTLLRTCPFIASWGDLAYAVHLTPEG